MLRLSAPRISRLGRIRHGWDRFTSTLAGDAVLVHVQRVEHVRVAIFPLTTSDRRVEVEGRAFCRRRAELAVLLQLQSAEQRIVSEIHSRRLFRVWNQRNRE